MVDRGLPELKKRGFYMPGSREILTMDEREEMRSNFIK